MKRFLLLFLATVVTAWSASAQLSVSQLRTEHLTDPPWGSGSAVRC